jgi:hypothetical protein
MVEVDWLEKEWLFTPALGAGPEGFCHYSFPRSSELYALDQVRSDAPPALVIAFNLQNKIGHRAIEARHFARVINLLDTQIS